MRFRKPWKARPKNPAFDGSLDERINARAKLGKGDLKEEFARLGAAEKIALINRIRRESKSVVIWVDNDATVFFNVPSEGIKPLDVGRRARFKKMYYADAHANILLKENQTRYYSLGRRKAPVVTSSATGPCIVFLAYRTNEKGEVTAAGVRHSYGAIHDPWRDYGVNILISEVARGPGAGPIRVKAVGYRSKKEKNIAGVRQMVLEHVAKAEKEAGVEVKIEKLELGKADRLTEVFPMNGEIRSIKYTRQKRKEGGSRKKEIGRF